MAKNVQGYKRGEVQVIITITQVSFHILMSPLSVA